VRGILDKAECLLRLDVGNWCAGAVPASRRVEEHLALRQLLVLLQDEVHDVVVNLVQALHRELA
jgi:hypothetical protein